MPLPTKVKSVNLADSSGSNITTTNPLPVKPATQHTAFGELSTAENNAFIQSAPCYDLLPSNFRGFSSGSGSYSVESKMFKVSSGTSVGGYGAIQSFRALNYKPGQGGLCRFTALFEQSAASSWQGAGLVNLGDELSFGYNGTQFGIWHRVGGYAEVRTVTVSGAASGSENLTLTLNGIGYTIPLTSGTVQHNAYEIAAWLNSNQSVWVADQLDDTVILSAQSDGAKSSTYSFSSSTATGSIAQTTAGVTKTSNFTAQTSWNQNTMSSLDPSKGNVYQISYKYLGFGDIKFYVVDSTTGEFVHVHTINYPNTYTTPNLTNPSLHIGIYCVSLGSTTDLVVRSASVAAFTQGNEGVTRNPRAYKNTATVTTSYTTIFSIRNRSTYNGYANQVEIEPRFLTVSSESGKNVEVEVRASSNPGIEQNYQTGGTNLVTDVSTTTTPVTNGALLTAFTIAQSSTIALNLGELRIRLPPSLHLFVQAKVTSGASASISAALTWYEDL